MRNLFLTALLTAVALAQGGPFTTFDCAVYGTRVEVGKEARVEGQDVLQGDSRILPAVDPSRLSPTGPNHRLEHSQQVDLKPGTYGRLEAHNSARFVLAPGEYRVEYLELSNSSDVDLEGPVVLSIGKTLSLSNSAKLNGRGKPADLVVYQAEPNRPIQVTLDNSSLARMALCGPTADVRLDHDAQLFGAIIARQVQLEGHAQVHYDPSLKEVKLRR